MPRTNILFSYTCIAEHSLFTNSVTDCGVVAEGSTCDDGDPLTTNDQCVAQRCQGQKVVQICTSDAECQIPENGVPCQKSGTCERGQCNFVLAEVGTACPYGYCSVKGKCSHIVIEDFGQVTRNNHPYEWNVIWIHAFGIEPDGCQGFFYPIDWSSKDPLVSLNTRSSNMITCERLNTGPSGQRVSISIDIPYYIATTYAGVNVVLVDSVRKVWNDPFKLDFLTPFQAHISVYPKVMNIGLGCEKNDCVWMVGENINPPDCSLYIFEPTDVETIDPKYIVNDGVCEGNQATFRLPNSVMQTMPKLSLVVMIGKGRDAIGKGNLYIELPIP
eukprot:Awhi_evm1s5251